MSEKGDVPFLGKLSNQPQSPGGNRGKGTPPMLKVITTKAEAQTIGATLDDLARDNVERLRQIGACSESQQPPDRRRLGGRREDDDRS